MSFLQMKYSKSPDCNILNTAFEKQVFLGSFKFDINPFF